MVKFLSLANASKKQNFLKPSKGKRRPQPQSFKPGAAH
jgi:hypothetical protein